MSDGTLTIIAYHYVRERRRSAFPGIHAIETRDFIDQLDAITRRCNVIDSATLLEAIATGNAAMLPPRAAYLTFDDGLRDHYQTVVPLLIEHGLHGAFFPSAKAARGKVVLDVHKIQFIIAASADADALARRILDAAAQMRAAFEVDSSASYRQRYYRPGRFDSAATNFSKQMLQHGLPASVRAQLIDLLFREIVTDDVSAFAEALYCDVGELRKMAAAGMYVGGHGETHRRLTELASPDQDAEIAETKDLLRTVGIATDKWIMCYPHGSHNAMLADKLRAAGCAVGLTVQSEIADLRRHDAMALPRLDTNDLRSWSDGDSEVAGSSRKTDTAHA